MKNLIKIILTSTLLSAGVNAQFISGSFAEQGYSQVYGLNIDDSDFHQVVPYDINISESIEDNSFDRIAYRMSLQKSTGDLEWVWVSMDTFTDDASVIGVPSFADGGHSFQQLLTNMNVFSNKDGIVTGTEIETGNIEFWPYNYGTLNDTGIADGSETTYDFSDESKTNYNYGSMQIHNYGANQTIFALNRFSSPSKDLGIGNQIEGGNPDWTFAQNSDDYSIKRLDVFVSNSESRLATAPVPSTLILLSLAMIGLSFKRKLK